MYVHTLSKPTPTTCNTKQSGGLCEEVGTFSDSPTTPVKPISRIAPCTAMDRLAVPSATCFDLAHGGSRRS